MYYVQIIKRVTFYYLWFEPRLTFYSVLETLWVYVKRMRLVGECETAHAGLNAEDVVVDSPHLEGVASLGGVDASLDANIDLSVVDAREVAGAGWLVLLGLEGERVAVDTRVRVAAVVPVGLDAVEELAGLVLEAVLTVEDETEGRERTDALAVGVRTETGWLAILEPVLADSVGCSSRAEV